MNNNPEEDALRWGEAERVSGLIAGFIRNTLTRVQREELNEWIDQSDRNLLLFEELTDKKNLEVAMAWMDGLSPEAALARAKTKINNKEEKKRGYGKYAIYMAAAIFLLAVGFFIWQRFAKNQSSLDNTEVARVNPDIAPGGNGAVLILADGTARALGLSDKALPVQAGAVLSDDSSRGLRYSRDAVTGERSLVFNKLLTPRGKQYRLSLSDGTQVWLNAASSIYYPVAFTGSIREVEVTGEVYFEVAHDGAHPFVVKVKGQNIHVLGTHFNVNAYPENPNPVTTLFQGSVFLSDSTKKYSTVLRPGFEAFQGARGFQTRSADTATVLAWKEGWFRFSDTKLNVVISQISRWYDVEVNYSSVVYGHFNGAIHRNVPVSQLLRLLEGTGSVHFEIRDREIIVKP